LTVRFLSQWKKKGFTALLLAKSFYSLGAPGLNNKAGTEGKKNIMLSVLSKLFNSRDGSSQFLVVLKPTYK